MAGTHNPTKTLTIQKQWRREVDKRYRDLSRAINKALLLGDAGGFVFNESAFQFKDNPKAVVEFMLWLQGQIDQKILDNKNIVTASTDFWQNKYIDRAYISGMERAKAQLRKAPTSLGKLLEDIKPADINGTAKMHLGAGIGGGSAFIGVPIHLDAIQTLYTRDFAQLKGITDAMSQQISRVLYEGVEQGLGMAEVARNINDRVNKIGRTRSRLLSRTETVRSYNVGVINEGIETGRRFNEVVNYKWADSDDGAVRPEHLARDGLVYNAGTAFSLIGEPNCRCALIPVIGQKVTGS